MPAKRLFGIISIIFLFVTCISCKSSTDLSEEKRILVIQSYEKHFPAYEKMKEIMSSELRKKGIHASVYSFYLHTSTQPVAPAIFSSSSTVSFTALWSSPAAG